MFASQCSADLRLPNVSPSFTQLYDVIPFCTARECILTCPTLTLKFMSSVYVLSCVICSVEYLLVNQIFSYTALCFDL